MISGKKMRPNDGEEKESAEEEMWNSEEKERQNVSASEEEILEDFVSQAEKGYGEREAQEKETLERLKKERGLMADNGEEQEEDRPSAAARRIFGNEIEPQKTFSFGGKGIFNSKGALNNFGQSNTGNRIKRVLKDADLKGVPVRKQREFVQLLQKYHGLKGKNLGTLDRNEVMKFEAGLRRGSSDARFNQFKEELKKEGVIKNSDDIKKLFSKKEARKISSALTGREDSADRFGKINKADLNSRREGGSGMRGIDRIF